MKSLIILASLATSFSSYASSCFQKDINVEMPDRRIVVGELCAESVKSGKNNSLIIERPYIKLPGYYKTFNIPVAANGDALFCQTLGLSSVDNKGLSSEVFGAKHGAFATGVNEMKVYRLGNGLFISKLICKN